MRNRLNRSELDSAIAEARRMSRGDILGQSLGLGFSTLLVMFAIASVVPFVRVGDPSGLLPATAQGAEWIAQWLGIDLIAAADWIIPVLVAAVFGVYASDYGSRRLFSQSAGRDTGSDDQARANVIITTVSVTTGWILVVYVVIVIVTAGLTGRHLGSAIAIAVFCGLLLAAAAWAGSLTPRTPAGLRRSATILSDRLEGRARRLPPENSRPLSRRRAIVRLTLWLSFPFAAAGLLLLVALFLPDDAAEVTRLLAAASGLAGVANLIVAFASSMSRDASLGSRLDKLLAGVMAVAFALVALSVILVLVLTLARAWPEVVALAAAGVASGVIVLAWCAPRSVLARSRLVWVSTPASAIDALLRRDIEKRRSKIETQLRHAEKYEEAVRRTRRGRFLDALGLANWRS